jgi:hypothetical protein
MKNSLKLTIVLILIGSTESKAKERHLLTDSIIQAATFEQLTTRFANPRPIDTAVSEGEGTCSQGTLFGKDTEHEFEVVWVDLKKREVAKVIFKGKMWRTNTGIGFDTTLKEIEKINGSPFSLTGFDWDYPGTITDFGKQGKLKKGVYVIRLDTKKNSKSTAKLKATVTGDQIFSSGHPSMQKINPTVYDIQLHFKASTAQDVACQ